MKMYNADLERLCGVDSVLETALMLPAPLAGLSSMESKTHCSKQSAQAGEGGCQRDRLRLDRDEDWPALGWGGPGAGLLTTHSVTT